MRPEVVVRSSRRRIEGIDAAGKAEGVHELVNGHAHEVLGSGGDAV
jgi:hypothetical protein